jgi:hypothetical protein
MVTVSARLVLLAAWVAGLVAACTAERQVLQNPAGVITSCDAVWNGAQKGAPCSFADRCERGTPGDSICCTDLATCVDEVLVLDQTCRTECNCSDDSQCAFGAELCEGRCFACPSTDVCPPCPDGWVPLQRNGCATCQCGPPPQCDTPGELCDPTGPGTVCYSGASCAEGCGANVPGCCSNTCAALGCSDPAPIGCVTACRPELGCSLCATSSCSCVDSAWVCDAICVENINGVCSYP